jgi:hypothetical protein
VADDLLLDDPDALVAADRRGLLRAAASAGAQVRRGLAIEDDDAVERAARDGRPRAVVVVGDAPGVGALLTSVARAGAPVPVVQAEADRLPGWAGALDVVVAVGATGREPEVLAAAGEAVRRGARTLVVAPSGTPLAAVPVPPDAGGAVPVHVEADAGPGATLWSLAVPVLRLAEALGLVDAPAASLEAAADRLDEVALRCGLTVPLGGNAAKELGLALAESSPVLWGSGPAGGLAAARLGSALAARAGVPARVASLGAAMSEAAGLLSGPWARPGDVDDVFRDRVETLTLAAAARGAAARRRADPGRAGAGARGGGRLTRAEVAVDRRRRRRRPSCGRRLVALVDWAAAYAALALGTDVRAVADDLARDLLVAEERVVERGRA